MQFSTGRTRLLVTSAIATGLLAATPGYAQTTPAGGEAAAAEAVSETTAVAADDERLVPLAGGGVIRPFGGGILPYAGTIRTFAGPVSGSAGTIRSFAGDTTASAGTIRSFAGTIRSFAGTLRSFQSASVPVTGPDSQFWGGLYPASGSLTANAGTIRSFAGEFEGMAGTIRSFAGTIRSFDGSLLTWDNGADNYTALNSQIATMVASSKATWGANVTAQTGKTFEAAFADRMLGKYGIDLNNAQSLVGMDEVGVEMFMLDWYDNLQLYSGADQVDHWMGAIRWNPRVTQDLGSGRDSKIGLLDFTVTGEGVSNVVKAGGVSTVSGLHGSAVLSLMTSAHDGRGVMGIAPGASVVTYNPFDASYTAGWADITAGVGNLVKNGATIINMSLGVPGWTLNGGWNTVFQDPVVGPDAKKRVFVLAAGNDGVTQTQNVTWAFDKNPAIIVVGSVDPNGTISDFSNRPGTVCLTKDGKTGPSCNDKDHQTLASRFIVAPGEWMLVSDGQGGVTRMSGTSFAAPLVSGTVALIHDRWPWLRDKPADTADLILSSARDIGAAGTDPVYGRGMLDVTAALSPASLAALTYKVSINGGGLTNVTNVLMTPAQRAAMISYWEANRAYVTGFDDTLTSYRDFSIPLSSKLAGQTVGTSGEQFNSYLMSRFLDWFSGGGSVLSGGKGLTNAFGPARFTSAMVVPGGLVASMSASPKAYRPGFRQDGVPYETGVALASANGGYALRFGTGRGGAALGMAGFAMQSDYEVSTGGANPFLGFASGSGYAAMDVALGRNLTVTTGVSRQEATRDFRWMGADERLAASRLDPYRATATTVTMQYRPVAGVRASVGYTGLAEASGLLGTQSIDRHDLGGGTRSDAGTAALDVAVTPTLAVSGVATWGRTRPGDVARQGIAVADGGAWSSAYQAAVTKVGLFGDDRLRLTLSQPLHLESGSIQVANVQVIDRQTGELGNVVQTFRMTGGERRYLGELMYGRSIAGGRASMNLFGRANLTGQRGANEAAVTVGSSFRLAL